jgi:NADH-quinone oxidoreductase subunit I
MFGLGLIKGLSVTMRHFVESYVHDRNPLRWFSLKGRYDQEWLEKRQSVDGKGLFTVQYPEQKRKITENFRVTPMLIYEEMPDKPRCTACGICARVCPPQTIWIQRATDDRGRPEARPAEFCIDATICMSCGFCAEFCPFDAIKMNQEHELAYTDRDAGMFYTMERLLKPVEYYASLHPTDYAREEAARQAKEEAKRKAAEAEEASEATASATPDDLTRIEGIGPKISAALQDAGIKTFAQLAATDVERLEQILEEAKLLRLAEPTTWPKQARLAASGKWEALEKWQDRLRGGKEA